MAGAQGMAEDRGELTGEVALDARAPSHLAITLHGAPPLFTYPFSLFCTLCEALYLRIQCGDVAQRCQ